VSIIKELKQFK